MNSEEKGGALGSDEYQTSQEILDIKPTDLVSATTSVVKEHIPPKTFSSLSSSESAAKADKTIAHAVFCVNGA